MGNITIDFEYLMKLRLVIARFGEMDLAKWWNTKGQLGRLGATALRRGFPRTHYFAQARSVFSVAAHRCKEVFDPPGCATLWCLPEIIEEEFDTYWEQWIDRATVWQSYFQNIESIQGHDLAVVLRSFNFFDDGDVDIISGLKRSAEGRAVLLPGIFSGSNEDMIKLAHGFAIGEPGALAVPYMRCP